MTRTIFVAGGCFCPSVPEQIPPKLCSSGGIFGTTGGQRVDLRGVSDSTGAGNIIDIPDTIGLVANNLDRHSPFTAAKEEMHPYLRTVPSNDRRIGRHPLGEVLRTEDRVEPAPREAAMRSISADVR